MKIPLLRKPKVKEQPYKGYTNCDIPAKLFFSVISTGDYSKLGTGTPQQCEDAFYAIFDEYHTLEENNGIKAIYKKNRRVMVLRLQIDFITTALHQIAYVPMTRNERLEVIKILNSLQGVRIKFNIENPIKDEIYRVQTQVIGALQTELKHAQDSDKKKTEGVNHTYERELANIAAIMGVYLAPTLTLYEFVEWRKLAQERVKQYKNGK